jgi:two-component sensor histidine kinase
MSTVPDHPAATHGERMASPFLDRALRGAGIVVAEQDRELRYRGDTKDLAALVGMEAAGKTDSDLFAEDVADVLAEAKRGVLRTGLPTLLAISFERGGEKRWYRVALEALPEGGGILSLFVDVTGEKASEQQVRASLRDLTHRSNNLIAVIQGIARQTVQMSADLPQFMESFSARLQALAGSLDLLTAGNRHGVEVGELARVQISQIDGDHVRRVSFAGEPVVLGPDAAQNIALAFHELGVNATRFGSLSNDAGRVELSWHILPGGEDFELVWQESDGPAVLEPARRGFGRVMVERIVPAALDGTVELAFDPAGVRWRVVFPCRHLAEAASSATRSL